MLLLTGGCGPVAQAVAAPVTLQIQPGDLLTRVPGLLDRYTQEHPPLRWTTPQTLAHGAYHIDTEFAGLATASPLGLVPLESALRSVNFDPGKLLPGALGAFSVGARVYGLPYVVMPSSISWRADAFAAAGLQPPARAWTLDDFEAACAALQAAITAGKVPGATSVLPVAAGIAKVGRTTFNGFLNDVSLAAAFAAGFGAPLFVRGQFRLTDPGALTALDRLVGIARSYGAPLSAAGQTGFVMDFDTLDLPHWPGVTPATTIPWRQARFPILPHVPMVPVQYQGVRVRRALMAAVDPIDPQVVAAVRFALWLYETDQQRLLEGAGLPPVVSQTQIQDAFWSVQPLGWDTAGDWRNFADPMVGWPPVNTSSIGGALMAEVQEPGLLGERLADVEQKLNNAVAQLPPGV